MDSARFLKLNPLKTEIIVFGKKSFHENLKIKGTFCKDMQCIRFSDSVKNLGVYLDKYLNFDLHISKIVSHSYMLLKKIGSIRKFLDMKQTETLVHALISSRIDMCNSLFYGIKKENINKLQRVQNAAIRLIFRIRKRNSPREYFQRLHWLDIERRIIFKVLLIVYKCIRGIAPIPLMKLIDVSNHSTLQLKINNYIPKSGLGDRSFKYYAPRLWNTLPVTVRLCENAEKFKGKLKNYLINNFDELKCKLNIYRS